MGYESRIFIIDRHERTTPKGDKWVYGEKIAMVNMCKMGYDSGFRELFTKPIDYKIFIDGVENYISFIPDSQNVDDDKDEYKLYLTDKEQETMAKILDAQLWEFTNMGIKGHIEAAAKYLAETN